MRTTAGIAWVLLSLLSLAAWADSGRSGAVLMQEPFGARAFAMGQAYAALGDEIFGMGYNPASLTRLPNSQAATQFVQSIADTQLGYIGVASPLDPHQALGANVAYLDAGSIAIFDSNGTQTSSVNAEKDFLAQLGYSHSWETGLPDGRLHLGVAGKVLRSTLLQQVSATGYAADFGGLYEAPWRGGLASMAIVLANTGPGIKYSGGIATGSASDPLPSTGRLAFGYTHPTFKADSLTAGIELDRVFPDSSLFEALGVEYTYHHLFSLRLGYRLGQDTAGLSMGAGLSIKDFSFDYAVGLVQTFNNVQQFSLTYRFSIPGVEYAKPQLSSLTPLEVMVRTVEDDIQAKRYFEALTDSDRLQTVFPDSNEGVKLQARTDRDVDALVNQGSAGARYRYALGFQRYKQGDMKGTIENLDAAFFREPENKEIQQYLQKAKTRYQEEQKQIQLQRYARIGTLYELANQAYESGDDARCGKIINEILRLGPYQPAESLKRKIEAQPRKPSPPPAKTIEVSAPSPEAAARAEALYYESLRDYADGRLEKAIAGLRQAGSMDPANENISSSLRLMENELKHSRVGNPAP